MSFFYRFLVLLWRIIALSSGTLFSFEERKLAIFGPGPDRPRMGQNPIQRFLLNIAGDLKPRDLPRVVFANPTYSCMDNRMTKGIRIQPMSLFDTHCHLDVSAFDADREAVLGRARQLGVRDILVPAIQRSGWAFLLDLCRREADLYPALGLHPMALEQHQPEVDLAALEQALAEHRVAGIGEIGLDYFLPELDRERQLALFHAQLQIAREARLPVILHVRKAHDEVLACLRRLRPGGGFVHAFNGSLEQARRYIELGFALGFGGMITYAGSTKLRALARDLPIEHLVLETDAPDMTVAAHRGERNSPEYLPDCLAALAEIKGEPPERIATITTQNARRVLGLEAPIP